MKKILFTLLAISTLLYSCSNDNDIAIFPNDNDQKYAITINAEFPDFAVSATNSTGNITDRGPIMYSLVVYKETGDVYYQRNYLVKEESTPSISDSTNIFSFDGKSASAKLELPVGKYYIAMLIHKEDLIFSNTSIIPIVSANYNTDNFGSLFYDNPSNYQVMHNGGVYFNNAELTVEKSETEQNINMALEPMWSYVDINITDAKTFKVPEGTDAIQFAVTPLYYGFNIRTKLGAYVYNGSSIIELGAIRKNSVYGFQIATTKSPLNNDPISVSINYLHWEDNFNYTILETRKLPLNEVILENGNYYTVKGDLTPTDPSRSISISSFPF